MSDRPDSSTGPQQTETTHSGSTSTFTAVGGGGPRVRPPQEPELNDAPTTIASGAVRGQPENPWASWSEAEPAPEVKSDLGEELNLAAQLADLRGERDQLLGLAQAFLGDDADDTDDVVLHVKNALTRLKEASDDGWALLDQIAEALEVSDGGKEWDRTDLLETANDANTAARELEALRAERDALQQQLRARRQHQQQLTEAVHKLYQRFGKDDADAMEAWSLAVIDPEPPTAKEIAWAQQHFAGVAQDKSTRELLTERMPIRGDESRGTEPCGEPALASADAIRPPAPTSNAEADLAALRSRGQALVQQWREEAALLRRISKTEGSHSGRSIWPAKAQQLEACADALSASFKDE